MKNIRHEQIYIITPAHPKSRPNGNKPILVATIRNRIDRLMKPQAMAKRRKRKPKASMR